MKKLCSIELTERELKALNDLAFHKDMSPADTMRQALRVYQAIEFSVNRENIYDMLNPPWSSVKGMLHPDL